MDLQRFVLAAVAFLAGGTALAAQTDSCVRRTIPVNLRTEKGQIVTGLATENFRAELHRKAVRIVSVTAVSGTPRVAVLIDKSGSMGATKGLWQANVAVARDLVKALPVGSQVSISTFSDKTAKLVPFTDDRPHLQEVLENVQADMPHGRTALWDALAEVAASQFADPRPGDSVYLISDGHDSDSKKSTRDVRRAFAAARIRLFAFSIAEALSSNMIPEGWSEKDLPDLVEAAGGTEVMLRRNPMGMGPDARSFPVLADKSGNPTEAGRALLHQFPLIFSYDAVVVELPEAIPKDQPLELKLQGLTERNLILSYPHILAACDTNVAASSIPKN